MSNHAVFRMYNYNLIISKRLNLISSSQTILSIRNCDNKFVFCLFCGISVMEFLKLNFLVFVQLFLEIWVVFILKLLNSLNSKRIHQKLKWIFLHPGISSNLIRLGYKRSIKNIFLVSFQLSVKISFLVTKKL